MTISLWRYAHLALALVASVFIFIASVTGGVLAFESVYNQTLPFKSSDFEDVTLSETIIALKEKYPEILSLHIDKNHFVKAEIVDNQGDNRAVYIHPKSAEIISGNYQQAEIFKFCKTLHRSLFMGKVGRVMVDITAILFFCIAISGMLLIIRKQKSWKRFFKKIVKEKFFNHYHTILGRLSLIPILIISLTGIYMGLETLSVIREFKPTHNIDNEQISIEPVRDISQFTAFDIPLSQVRKVDFPAFEDIEEFYKVELIDKELIINQFTGEIISKSGNWSKIISHYVEVLHIGQGTPLWAGILFIACFAILFFIYSGFAITLKRRKSSIKNPFGKDECSYVILVGSEGGTTLSFANLVHQQLLSQGKKSFLAEMNAFSSYPKMEHLLVFTCTYGQGDAPSNASKFLDLWKKNIVNQSFTFSVVGFGSLAYPDFCKFAIEVDTLLRNTPMATPLLNVYTINNQSFEAFSSWANLWAEKQQIALTLAPENLQPKKRKQHSFKVIEKTPVNDDSTFLIRLQPTDNVNFTSGDLLGITSEIDNRIRWYSIAKLKKNQLLLSVKRHEKGIVSNLLNLLKSGDYIKGRLQKNPHFHFPKKTKQVVCIATGTGIAPFIGMLANNHKQIPATLIWGGKTSDSFSIYKEFISEYIQQNRLNNLYLALSRSDNKQYVQDVVAQQSHFIANLLKNKGVIMICGSVAMQKEVINLLENICKTHLQKSISYFQNRNQILMDCY